MRLGSLRAKTLKTQPTTSLFLLGLVALGLGSMGRYYAPPFVAPAVQLVEDVAAPVVQEIADSAPIQTVAEIADEVQEIAKAAVSEEPEDISRVVELGRGDTLSQMLMNAGVPDDMAYAASRALGTVYDHRQLKAGEEFTLSLERRGEVENLEELVFQPSPTQEIVISRLASGDYKAQIKAMPLERQRFAARGEIKSSLFAAGERAGVPLAVMASLIRAYSHEIDFQRDLRKGDKFEVLYDQPTAQDGTPVGQGIVVYAALIIGNSKRPIYRVTFKDGVVDYFDAKGRSIKRSLLRTPLEHPRITSPYGQRRHPILGYSKMHKGVDFGASHGTPIFAAGTGVVETAKYNGSYGRFILLRHNNRTETAYAHMHRFAKGIHLGARVSQGDVIGYVGSTGRSTGPHLHYEVRIDKKQVNPLKVSMPVGRSLAGNVLKQFEKGQAKITQEFKTLLEKSEQKQTQAEDAVSAIKVTG
jgi:murein DD-endopeptidase MepM/ murein hydrolase activator NlpD